MNVTLEIFNRERFFEAYKKFIGRLNANQIDAIDFLLGRLAESKRIRSIPKQAYVLATVAWESAYTYEPITEYGSEKYLKSKKYYPFIGRGYVQLTWKENYHKFGKTLGLDLVGSPGLANDPNTAWKVLEIGMTDTEHGIQDPDFTKYTLEDFFTKEKVDYHNARKIINPGDKDSYKPIAEMAERFSFCLSSAIIVPANIPAAKGVGYEA